MLPFEFKYILMNVFVKRKSPNLRQFHQVFLQLVIIKSLGRIKYRSNNAAKRRNNATSTNWISQYLVDESPQLAWIGLLYMILSL